MAPVSAPVPDLDVPAPHRALLLPARLIDTIAAKTGDALCELALVDAFHLLHLVHIGSSRAALSMSLTQWLSAYGTRYACYALLNAMRWRAHGDGPHWY